MVESALVAAGMGAVFFLIPSVLLVSTSLWLVARVRNGTTNASSRTRLSVATSIGREPLQLALMLPLTGLVLAGFVAGDLGSGTYLSVASAALELMMDSLFDWRDATSPDAVSLRGFGFIMTGSTATAGWTMWRFYKGRWTAADQEERRRALDAEAAKDRPPGGSHW